jgi:hypothetical protein
VRIHTDAGTLDISAPVTGLSIEPPYMVASTIGDEPHLCQPISHHVSVHWTPHRPGEAKAAHSYEDARACGMALTTTGPIME